MITITIYTDETASSTFYEKRKDADQAFNATVWALSVADRRFIVQMYDKDKRTLKRHLIGE